VERFRPRRRNSRSGTAGSRGERSNLAGPVLRICAQAAQGRPLPDRAAAPGEPDGRTRDRRARDRGKPRRWDPCVIVGPRRTRKTTVCDAALRILAKNGIYTVVVDSFRISSAAELAEVLWRGRSATAPRSGGSCAGQAGRRRTPPARRRSSSPRPSSARSSRPAPAPRSPSRTA
jgi:hypothetical protein